MIRRFLTFLIIITLITGGVALAMPEQAQKVAAQILRGFGAIEQVRMPLIGGSQTSLRVVDPATIASKLKEEGSNLISLFDKRTDVGGNNLTVEDIIDATNKERIAAGLPPLRTNE